MNCYNTCQCYCHNTTGDFYVNGCSLCSMYHQQFQPFYPTQIVQKDDHYKIIQILNEIKSILLDIKNGKKRKPRTRKTTRSKGN